MTSTTGLRQLLPKDLLGRLDERRGSGVSRAWSETREPLNRQLESQADPGASTVRPGNAPNFSGLDFLVASTFLDGL